MIAASSSSKIRSSRVPAVERSNACLTGIGRRFGTEREQVTARACDRWGYPAPWQATYSSRAEPYARRHPLEISTPSSHPTASASSVHDRRPPGDAHHQNAYEPRTKATGMAWEQWQEMLASRA